MHTSFPNKDYITEKFCSPEEVKSEDMNMKIEMMIDDDRGGSMMMMMMMSPSLHAMKSWILSYSPSTPRKPPRANRNQ